MPGRDGTGPTGEGRPGRGLGRCGKAKQAKKSDTDQGSKKNRDAEAAGGRRAGGGGGRGQGGSGRRGRV